MDTAEDQTVIDNPSEPTSMQLIPENETPPDDSQQEISPIPKVTRDSCREEGASNEDKLSTASVLNDPDKTPEDANACHLDIPDRDLEDLSLKSASDGENSVFTDNPENQQQEVKNNESENESEELDDIELIFTTDETCRDVGLQEDLVSITENEPWQQSSGQPVLLKYTKSVEGESSICNGDKTSSVEDAMSSQSSSIDREESVDRFDESSNTRLNKIWSQCSVLVETDISKCGVLEEVDMSSRHAIRRNTLAAPPTAYR